MQWRTEVFAAFLDKRLKYISGLFLSQDATLEEAQTAKPTKHYALTATRSRMGI